MANDTETLADTGLPRAVVVDRATGQTSEGVVLPPADPAFREARLANAGLMSAGVAHDLGNLMQIIDAGVRGLERRLDERANPELAFLAREVRGAAVRASALTRRILDYSRGQAEVARPVDVGAVIAQMKPLIGWAAGPSVRWVLEIEPRLPLTRCAPAELESALINLVINARHAMPEGGALTLSACRQGRDVMVRVADTGCGMSPDAARRACDPFFSTRSGQGGSGLGLAMVSAFVRGAGGSIHVDSALGRGTAITLILPGADAPQR